MSAFRRRLRLWATVWLVFQAASLHALVPRECCGAHRPAAAEPKKSCHEPAPAPHCPMRAADGTACPMHRGGQDKADHSSTPPADGRCSMRGTCGGPLEALVTFLSFHGVLTDPPATAADLHPGGAGPCTDVQPIARRTPPESPPPRA